MSDPDKPLVWFHGAVKTPPFSRAARQEAGLLLRRLQRGEVLAMPHSRPMPSIGRGCHELRLRDTETGKRWRIAFRVDPDAVVILEVFQKASRRTPEHVVEACRHRLAEYDRLVGGGR